MKILQFFKKKSFIIFIKTYKKDFSLFLTLISSIEKYNADKIPVYVSVNDDDYDFFLMQNIKKIHLLKDSSIAKCGIVDGWRYQQFIKSQVYRLDICENYLCVDSDSEFIKNFYVSDFMFNESTPYTIMHESKDRMLINDIMNFEQDGLFFQKTAIATRKYIPNKGKIWDFGPSPYIFSCKVWKSFIEEFLTKKSLTFEQFFNKMDKIYMPSEVSFYGEYILFSKKIEIVPIEPLFKVFHFKEQYDQESKLYTVETYKKHYLGIIKQSNWI
jgi:hypothetical protein